MGADNHVTARPGDSPESTKEKLAAEEQSTREKQMETLSNHDLSTIRFALLTHSNHLADEGHPTMAAEAAELKSRIGEMVAERQNLESIE